MATKEKAEQPAVNLSIEQLQMLMETMAKTVVQEQHAVATRMPPEMEARLKAKKAHWEQVLAGANEMMEQDKKNCTHRRREDGYSVFWKFANVFPQNAMTLICCRCRKTIQNYGDNKDVEAFNFWYTQPTGASDTLWF